MQFSIGPSIPVRLDDPVNWRSLVCSYSLQGGHYALPTKPWYPWDKWENLYARSNQHSQQNEHILPKYETDDSRLFVYSALESFINQNSNGNGRECLLRTICENAQIHHHVGIMAEILNAILTYAFNVHTIKL